MRNPSNGRSPTLLRLRAPVAPDGTLDALGLAYRPVAGAADLAALADAGHASLLVDPDDVGAVLVRHPGSGALLRARCTREAYASGLTLAAHAAARRSAAAAATSARYVATCPGHARVPQPAR